MFLRKSLACECWFALVDSLVLVLMKCCDANVLVNFKGHLIVWLFFIRIISSFGTMMITQMWFSSTSPMMLSPSLAPVQACQGARLPTSQRACMYTDR